jgi:hypothetical protein
MRLESEICDENTVSWMVGIGQDLYHGGNYQEAQLLFLFTALHDNQQAMDCLIKGYGDGNFITEAHRLISLPPFERRQVENSLQEDVAGVVLRYLDTYGASGQVH